MSVNDNSIIFKRMYRIKFDDSNYTFEEILKNCILDELTHDSSKAELMALNKVNRLWNKYRKEHEEDKENGVVPLFSIISENEKVVQWIGDSSDIGIRKEYFKIRPDLYDFMDRLDEREYEKMACIICEFLGADKILLTDPGNEGGIDFFARIPFSKRSHFLFGVKGPIRIVGQCKKYSQKDNVGHMKEFVQTLGHVYNRSYRAGQILPDWFQMEKGDIIGWHIANMGHQTGAKDMAKNYGIILSDSKQLIDIICRAKIVHRQKNVCEFLEEKLKYSIYN